MISKKILLVGGCGFIGHNLALHLKKKGYLPTIIDSLSINNINSLDNNEVKNQKLYRSILENRISLLNETSRKKYRCSYLFLKSWYIKNYYK